ncbi:MAG: pyridoxal-phosphate dependent enzyme [Steroidobacteraceae bacterium]
MGATYPLSPPRWRSDAGNALLITPLPGIRRRQIDSSDHTLWRYAAALPVRVREPISLGEGRTPLVSRLWRKQPVLLKLEWFSPTGSFKDRGASVMLSVLREQGVSEVIEDSSGNGGAAIAAYAAAGRMRSKILVPASTPLEKTIQMRAYGAHVELVPGSRQDTAEEAVRQSVSIFYAGHNWQAHFLQGTKTLAYELWEDLHFRAPDNVIVPLGAGSNVLGCAIGFGELARAGAIERVPRIFGVQPANCAPIHASFVHGSGAQSEVEVRPTVAEGAAIARPLRLPEIVQVIRSSGGATIAASEEQISAAALELAATGIYVEPTAAMSAAGMTLLLKNGRIRSRDRTVLVLTGSGLKATQRMSELIASAQACRPGSMRSVST